MAARSYLDPDQISLWFISFQPGCQAVALLGYVRWGML